MVDFVYDPIIGLKYYFFGPTYEQLVDKLFTSRKRPKIDYREQVAPKVNLQRKTPYPNTRDYRDIKEDI